MQSLGTRRVERGERQGEGSQSGRASEASSGVDGRAGSSVGEGSLRGLQPPSRLARRASQNRQCHVAGHEQPILFGREQFSCRERQLSPSRHRFLQPHRRIMWSSTTNSHSNCGQSSSLDPERTERSRSRSTIVVSCARPGGCSLGRRDSRLLRQSHRQRREPNTPADWQK